MAAGDTKISALDAIDALVSADSFPVYDASGSDTNRVTGTQIIAWLGTSALSAASLACGTYTTASGGMTFTPFAGQDFTIALETTGDLIVNTDDFFVDTSADNIGIGTATPALSTGNGLHMARANCGIRLQNTSDGGWGFIEYANEANAVQFIQGHQDTTTTFRIIAGTSLGALTGITMTSNGYVGIHIIAPASPLHVRQTSASGAVACLELEQDDTDVEFIEFDGTSAADGTASISSSTGESGACFGKIRVTINGVTKWLRVYDDHT